MVDVGCILVATTIEQDNIGNEIEKKTEINVPIIKVENIYSSEFYSASQNGFKPSLRIKISALNYNEEPIVKYLGVEYDVIRVDREYADEISLICEKRIKNEA